MQGVVRAQHGGLHCNCRELREGCEGRTRLGVHRARLPIFAIESSEHEDEVIIEDLKNDQLETECLHLAALCLPIFVAGE